MNPGWTMRRIADGVPLALVVPLAVCLAWEVAVRAFRINERLLPAPSTIIEEMYVKAPLLMSHGVTTVGAVLLGFLASAVIGILLGALLVSSKWLDLSIFPLLLGSQAIPKIAVAPLLLIWFGNGLQLKMLVTFLMAFFPVLIDTMIGFRALPRETLLLARSMGASPFDLFRKFRLPHALPYIFSGLRISAVFAVSGTVVAEFVGAETGLVYLLVVGQAQHQTALVFAVVVILSILSMLMFGAVELAERRFVPWYGRRRAPA